MSYKQAALLLQHMNLRIILLEKEMQVPLSWL